MTAAMFQAGLGLGLAVAVPIGPMGVLCIQRTLAGGLSAGLATGFGAAIVQASYGAAIILGPAALLGADTLGQLGTGLGRGLVQLFSAALLALFAFRLLRRSGALRADPTARPGRGLRGCFLEALALGLANPLTLALLAAAIPALVGPEAVRHAPVVLLGQFCGAVLWWLMLSGAVSVLRGRLRGSVLARINHCAALALGATAVLTALRALP
jgi:threonine/homoserine/homoserine lactone efflux protein